MNDNQDNWYLRLLEGITAAQSQLIGSVEANQLFDGLLNALLDLCDSEYGFIGETHYTEEGEIYLKTHAITNIAWNDYTRRYYEENAPGGLEFKNLKTLFGAVLTGEKAVIANSPQSDRIIEVSNASVGLSGGRMPGNRAASIDLPDPGVPTKSVWWRPAAAISSARLARS